MDEHAGGRAFRAPVSPLTRPKPTVVPSGRNASATGVEFAFSSRRLSPRAGRAIRSLETDRADAETQQPHADHISWRSRACSAPPHRSHRLLISASGRSGRADRGRRRSASTAPHDQRKDPHWRPDRDGAEHIAARSTPSFPYGSPERIFDAMARRKRRVISVCEEARHRLRARGSRARCSFPDGRRST